MITKVSFTFIDQVHRRTKNDLPVIGYPCLCKNPEIVRGRTLRVARRKCVAKSCVELQKKRILKRDQRFFAVVLSQMELGSVDMWRV